MVYMRAQGFSLEARAITIVSLASNGHFTKKQPSLKIEYANSCNKMQA